MDDPNRIINPIILWLGAVEDDATNNDHSLETKDLSQDDESYHKSEDGQEGPTPNGKEPMKLMLKDGTLRELHSPTNTTPVPARSMISTTVVSSGIGRQNHRTERPYVPPQKRREGGGSRSQVQSVEDDSTSSFGGGAAPEEEKKEKAVDHGKRALKTNGKTKRGKRKRENGKLRQCGFEKKARAIDAPWR